VRNYLILYSKEFIQNGKLKGDKFLEFLTSLKVIADNLKSYDYLQDSNSSRIDEGILENDMSLILDCDASMLNIRSINDTILLFSLRKSKQISYNSINQSFLPGGIIGLNNASKEKELARNLMSFMLSKEVQGSNLNDGFPVNRSSLQKLIGTDNDNFSLAVSTNDGEMVTGDWPIKEERDEILDMATKVTVPIDINQVIFDMIIEETIPYLKGEAEAEQVKSALESKINIYMAE
jgi:hypothetical protein